MKPAKDSPITRQTSNGRQGISRVLRHGQSSRTIWSGCCKIKSRARAYGTTVSIIRLHGGCKPPFGTASNNSLASGEN